MLRNLVTVTFVVLILMAGVSVHALSTGELAPPLTAEKWFNGSAVNPAEPDGKTIYVVEFWATWCPPCKKSIPHLNELHERLAERGVVIVGVTTEEEKVVKPFIEKSGVKYRIAIASRKQTEETWMADIDGIPHAFVVGTNGVILWAGHPLDGLDNVLDDVLAGTFDPATYAEKAENRDGDLKHLQELLIEGQFDEALATVNDKLGEPSVDARWFHLKLGILAQLDRRAELKATYSDMVKRFWEDAEQLNTVAWLACSSPPPLCDLGTAWKAANRAVELSKSENPAILDTLARVYYCVGQIAEAIRTQSLAVEKASKDKDVQEDLRATLEYYKDAQALSEQITIKE